MGNTLTAVARLGLPCALLTKLGTDANGKLILAGLQEEGIDTSPIVTSAATPSPFTYIIVDKSEATRTCIHTAMTEELLPSDVTSAVLQGAALLHCDARMTHAAVTLAQLARSESIPIVLDCEKDRPHFSALLPLADYLVCNSGFAQSYMQCDSRLEGMAALLRLGAAKLVVSTLGAEGSVLMYEDPPWAGFDTAAGTSSSSSGSGSTSIDSIPLAFKHSKYSSSCSSSSSSSAAYSVVHCSAWPVQKSEIVDTTGAYYNA